ncbi:bifunctional [glutamine synthetase] adenylyltransferase/[glutamine synthetase]-adenylyl-L-tyrosine phosphorylase [Glacieibacterium frigidum]|uniref:Bifunctional [glutamine synthetase] adenylyltransferase/[glutamine synthetase]-adenylyl-L-tyrosine phosphorylase n=1 Tax=Glacieibacterium frigidum TaxID=2593303 RepID=A0A552UAS5_9SPHN|nr:bifunctional [glutamine synthetase] adenylyltransferase/[glutamine synthetase]-adenylyl-L-tyrosine phosphorylase [Glacieibacterium frigidum]
MAPLALDEARTDALTRAWTHAPYLRGLIRGHRDALDAAPETEVAAALAQVSDTAQPVFERLRAAKRRAHLAIALADLSGAWPLESVTHALSDLADACIDAAIAEALAERNAPNAGFVALALGKLGSRELNYSSDVDLILLYDPGAVPVRAREDAADAAVRIAKRAVAILNDRTADGYAWRVDLRLRPASEITPLALPVAAAEHYYQSEAETWERTAFIRSRACGGDVALGEAFLRAIGPFVWRRSLDYTAIHDIQSVSLRIRDHFDAGQKLGPGFDLKRGRGGIREVEFFAQLHQLVWGGRDPALRAPATLDALAALAAAGRIDAGEAATLGTAYRRLRTVEHRLQMLHDAQTHSIPTVAGDRTALAAMCDEPDWRTLERHLKGTTAPIARAFDRLIGEAKGDAPGLPTDSKALRTALGKGAAALAPMVERWRTVSYRSLRSPAARASFERLLPSLAASLAQAADPATAAARLDAFLSALPAGVQLFALLEANPALVPLLGRLLGVTPLLADALARTPALFDVLLGGDAFDALPDAGALAAELKAQVAGARDVETVLDRVRRWTGERRFQLGAQLIEGRADPLRVARDLSHLADAALQLIVRVVTDDFAATHGRVAGGELIVVAFGRYGGAALTHASDLDLVLLFSGAHDAVSDGAKPLAATRYFNSLGARVVAALSVPTAAGALYEVDTRLRPFGAKGLLAVSLDSFVRYQMEEAEAWEHMALTRARVVAGPAAEAQAAIAAILNRAPSENLAKQVLAMRADIAAAKPGGGKWDVKLSPGGLVDLEFIVHFLQLRDRAAVTPDLGAAIGALRPDLADAHDLLTRTLVTLRLVGANPAPQARALLPDDAALGLAKTAVVAAWSAVFGQRRSGT